MLKPPVNIDSLTKEWSEDSIISPENINTEILKISSLHSKYVTILSYHRRQIKKYEMEYKLMKETRRAYFNGELNNPEDLADLGWEPYQFVTKTNSEMERKIECDKLLNKILMKKMEHEEILDTCMSILKSLNNRSYELKAYVDYVRIYGEVK